MAVLMTGGGVPPKVHYINYIQSNQSNGTQYIDTEYTVKSNNLKIEARFSIIEMQAWRALFGSEQTGSGPWSIAVLINGDSGLSFYSGNSENVGSVPVSVETVYNFSAQSNNGKLTYSCGGNSGTLTISGSMDKTRPIYLFTLNSPDSVNITGQSTNVRLYEFRIYDDGTLVRDFKPCYDPEGVACLYDQVGKKYHYNAGFGEFTAG